MPRGTDKRATGACPKEPPGIPGLGVQRRENAPRRPVRRPKENSQFAYDSIAHELRYSLHTVDVAKIDVYNNFCIRRDTRMRTDAGRVRKRSCRAEACLPSRKREPYSVAEARIACYSRENQKCFGGTHDPGSLFFDHISTIRKNAEGTSSVLSRHKTGRVGL